MQGQAGSSIGNSIILCSVSSAGAVLFSCTLSPPFNKSFTSLSINNNNSSKMFFFNSTTTSLFNNSLQPVPQRKIDDPETFPEWLSAILSEKFFNACIIHEDKKKNEKNVLCLDCCEGICAHCFLDHASHRLLQIRRYVYYNVIRVGDAEKLMDCDDVQRYTSNKAKVIFLQQRPLPTSYKASGKLCLTCGRNLHDPHCYCSISCKIQHLLRTGCNISEHLRKCEFLDMPEPGSQDEQMTPDSVLEPDGWIRNGTGSASGLAIDLVECTSTAEIVRKKRTSLSRVRSHNRPDNEPGCETSNADGMANRRKGVPRRAPLH